MGCIQKHQQITIKKPLIHNKTTFYSNYKNTFSLFDRFSTLGNSDDDLKFYYKNKSNKLTKQSWIRVLSFLKFNELKEIGKINRRHRRSKHEQEGRIYNCEHCGKSYLSKPALNNHMNTKHDEILKQMNIEKRKRGRPRKYLIDSSENNNNYEKLKYIPYFQEGKRIKNSEKNEINCEEVVKKVFEDLYKKYGGVFYKNINEPKENPILNYLLNKNEITDKNCDEIICKYLNYIMNLTNEKYFTFITKFIILFRECINGIQAEKNNDKYGNKEYTSIENAEIFPEQCNEFFSNFLEKNNFFDFSEDDKIELIEIIQHFCYWLLLNNYTKSKLSLAS